MPSITIYLGSKCNLNCKYCHRQADKDESPISDEIIQFLKDKKFDRVKFIGGEPTLYMDDIYKIVDSLPKNTKYSISTNGIGITQYVPYFLDHDFFVVLSYDGSNDTSIRGFDPFTHLFRYPKLGVSCTLYHGNTDFETILKNFRHKRNIIGRYISFFPHIVHVTKDKNPWFKLTKDDYDSIIEQYDYYLTDQLEFIRNGNKTEFLYNGLLNQLYTTLNRHYDLGETYCVHHNLLKMDSKGNCLQCLYVRDNKYNWDTWKEDQYQFIKENFPNCLQCKFYSMCGSACIKSVVHEDECYYYKKLFTLFLNLYSKYKEEIDNLHFKGV